MLVGITEYVEWGKDFLLHRIETDIKLLGMLAMKSKYTVNYPSAKAWKKNIAKLWTDVAIWCGFQQTDYKIHSCSRPPATVSLMFTDMWSTGQMMDYMLLGQSSSLPVLNCSVSPDHTLSTNMGLTIFKVSLALSFCRNIAIFSSL